MDLASDGVEYAKFPVKWEDGVPEDPPLLEVSIRGSAWLETEYLDENADMARILVAGPDVAAEDLSGAHVLVLGDNPIRGRWNDSPEIVIRQPLEGVTVTEAPTYES